MTYHGDLLRDDTLSHDYATICVAAQRLSTGSLPTARTEIQ